MFDKIAVLSAKALGDLIVILPALEAIKETYPHTELVLLAKPWVHGFLAARPSAVDRVVSVPLISGGGFAATAERGDRTSGLPVADIQPFYEAMRAEKFDVAMHMQGDGETANPFINRLGAGMTVGLRNPATEPLDRSIPYVHYQSEVLRNLEIVALIGARTSRIEPHLEVTGTDEEEAAGFAGNLEGETYIVIHAGADDMRRRWPPEKFAAAADHLAAKGYIVVLTGTPKENEIITGIMEAMRHDALPCTSLALGGLAALLRGSALVVSNDTGPLHLARAVGTPTVGIYWAPNVLNWGPLNRNSHRLAISWELECQRCGIKPVTPYPFQPLVPGCDHLYSFVESISVAEVMDSALQLLSSQGPSRLFRQSM